MPDDLDDLLTAGRDEGGIARRLSELLAAVLGDVNSRDEQIHQLHLELASVRAQLAAAQADVRHWARRCHEQATVSESIAMYPAVRQ